MALVPEELDEEIQGHVRHLRDNCHKYSESERSDNEKDLNPDQDGLSRISAIGKQVLVDPERWNWVIKRIGTTKPLGTRGKVIPLSVKDGQCASFKCNDQSVAMKFGYQVEYPVGLIVAPVSDEEPIDLLFFIRKADLNTAGK